MSADDVLGALGATPWTNRSHCIQATKMEHNPGRRLLQGESQRYQEAGRICPACLRVQLHYDEAVLATSIVSPQSEASK